MNIERQLPVEELIRLEAMRHSQVRLTIEGDKLIITPCEKPRGYILKNTSNIFIEAIPLILQQGEAIVSGENNWIQIYSRVSVAIWFDKSGISYKKMTNWKRPEPIFVMGATTYKGYKEITEALFGKNHQHIRGVETMLSDLLPVVDFTKLRWVKTIPANGRIKEHKVYEYEGKNYKGKTALKKAFPNLTDKQLKEFDIEKAEPSRERHEELIKKYEITLLYQDNKPLYSVSGLEKDYYRTKAELLKALRNNKETVARETAKKMHDTLEETNSHIQPRV